MMTNLLAILVSLAMMLTGASAPLAQPVSRTALISDITVHHNDEEVTLSPYASIGVMTDGAKVLFDFYIGKDDKLFLPFQAVVDESGVTVTDDNANVTLKIDKDKLESLITSSVSVEGSDGTAKVQPDNSVAIDESNAELLGLIGDYMSAYVDILKLIGDPKASKEIQDKADALFDQLVDRGEGQPGTVEYDDEIYDVTNYEYDLDARQLGALTDAMFTTDERLTHFYTSYFSLLKALPDDSGLNGLESFEQIMEMVGDVSVHVNESIAESGLVLRDMIMHIAVPDMETPVEMVSHEVRDGDIRTSEINAEIIAEDNVMTLFAEAIQSGQDLQMDMTMTFNPVAEAQEADEEAEAVEAYDAPAEEDEESEEAPIDLDGEGDAVDAFSFTMDYDRSIDEERGNVTESATYSIDASEQDVHFDMNIDGVEGDDGESDYQVTGGLDFGEESFGFGFTIDISDEEIDERIDASKAVSLDGFDPSVLLASVSADGLNLYTDESVQKLIAMGKAFMESVQASNAPEAEPEEDDVEDIEDVAPVDIDPDALDLEMPEMTFGNPQFNWLPEGYHVDDLNVDEEYQDVSLALVNDETGDRVYVDITNSYMGTDINHYSVNEDGTFAPIEGDILNEEIGEDYAIYSMDDGTLAYSFFPSTGALGAEDIVHILSELTF